MEQSASWFTFQGAGQKSYGNGWNPCLKPWHTCPISVILKLYRLWKYFFKYRRLITFKRLSLGFKHELCQKHTTFGPSRARIYRQKHSGENLKFAIFSAPVNRASTSGLFQQTLPGIVQSKMQLWKVATEQSASWLTFQGAGQNRTETDRILV